jgi:hypothetical protein
LFTIGSVIILNPAFQNSKVIDVWVNIEPNPLFAVYPIISSIFFVFIGIAHAFIYRWLAPAWPSKIGSRAWRISLLVFFLSFSFFEFMTPLNLLREPIPLVIFEHSLWAIVALAEGFIIAAVMEGGNKEEI